jgi:hypothetical protein
MGFSFLGGFQMNTASKRVKKVVVVVAIVLVCLCIIVYLMPNTFLGRFGIYVGNVFKSVSTASRSGFQFPDLADIERMTVSDWPADGIHAVDKFDVPKKFWGELIEALSPSEYDPRPATWVVNGYIIIDLKRGGRCEVHLYQIGGEPPTLGAFSAGADFLSRKYYRGGNENDLSKALTRARAAYLSANKPVVEDQKTVSK